jgi:uncharacterized protein YbjT (DUF2867 family)
MIAVTGATGHTGKVVAETLLAAGEKVRVIGRSADKLQPFVAKGAEAFVGNVLDTDAMTRAFQGVDAAYVMIPPDLKQPKMRAYMADVSDSLAKALEKALVKYAVSLSSVGAQLKEGAGPVSGLHDFEARLNCTIGLNVLHLRAAYFMENTLMCVQVYKTMGFYAALLKGDLPIGQIASRDIGARAAAELRALKFSGQNVTELLGQRDISLNETAKFFGTAIGKPGLGYTQAPAMMAKPALMQAGLSSDTADQMIEMSKAINEGRMVPLEKRNESNTTPTTFESFTAEVLVPAYKAQTASA